MNPLSPANIDIIIDDVKRYFPGDMIRGHVEVCPQHSTRTESILVIFAGTITLSINNRTETFALFEQKKHLRLSSGGKREFVLQANMTYTFYFAFMIPDDLQLPSEMEYKNQVSILYLVTAIQKQYGVPVHQCPLAQFRAPVYEFINIESTSYRMPQKIIMQARNSQCKFSVSTTRTGFPIGATIPVRSKLSSTVDKIITQSLDVSLVRSIDIQNGRYAFSGEEVVERMRHTVDTRTQEPLIVTTFIRIPEFGCPTMKYNALMLRVRYHILVMVKFNSSLTGSINIRLPIAVGTWPSNMMMANPQNVNNTTPANANRSTILLTANMRSNPLFGPSLPLLRPNQPLHDILYTMRSQFQPNESELITPSSHDEPAPVYAVSSAMSHISDTSTLVNDYMPHAVYRAVRRSMPSLESSVDGFGGSLSSDSEDDEDDGENIRIRNVYNHGTYLIAR